MDNRKIAEHFNLLGKLMELHDENPFKFKSYTNAYLSIKKIGTPLSELTADELDKIPGVGKAIREKIGVMLSTGKLPQLEKYKNETPEGVIEMLQIRGLGPKKVRTIWRDLGIESVGELKYACDENRLVAATGFGFKTQESIKEMLEYYSASMGLYHYATIFPKAEKLLVLCQKAFPGKRFVLTGDLYRQMPVVDGIYILTNQPLTERNLEDLGIIQSEDHAGYHFEDVPVRLETVPTEALGTQQFLKAGSQEFLAAFEKIGLPECPTEEDIFGSAGCTFIPAPRREDPKIIQLAKAGTIAPMITVQDIKGVVHSHSTYSDGIHSIDEMAEASATRGYGYLVMTDHSKAAFYANGLSEERVEMQWREIDELNTKFSDFRIFKGIEADILTDGSLDYDQDFLSGFECVIASIHSVLRMTEEKATERLIRAIENPRTHILGHPTGRLLLARAGYPIDHHRVIDACAHHGVAIELNASPQRLDMDWSYMEYAMKKGVLISINPDAHSREAIDYIKWGVAVSQKAGLTAEQCLNTKSAAEFDIWLQQKR